MKLSDTDAQLCKAILLSSTGQILDRAIKYVDEGKIKTTPENNVLLTLLVALSFAFKDTFDNILYEATMSLNAEDRVRVMKQHDKLLLKLISDRCKTTDLSTLSDTDIEEALKDLFQK